MNLLAGFYNSTIFSEEVVEIKNYGEGGYIEEHPNDELTLQEAYDIYTSTSCGEEE